MDFTITNGFALASEAENELGLIATRMVEEVEALGDQDKEANATLAILFSVLRARQEVLNGIAFVREVWS